MLMRQFLLGAAILLAACQARETGFAGDWVLRYQDRNLIVLKIAADRTSGSLSKPERGEFDGEGTFHEIGGKTVAYPLSSLSEQDGKLKFTAEGNVFFMTQTDADHAEVRFEEAPAWIAPMKFERATGDVAVATDWPQPQRTPEILAVGEKINEMAEEDQAVRMARPFSEKVVLAADAKHLPELRKIHDQYGWPTRSLFGKVAADNFWVMVQHQGTELQAAWLPELERLAQQGEASRHRYALLFDRVQKGLGKPQRWGTQTSCVNGKAVMDPVEDPERLDERRRELYFDPIEEYVRGLDESCAATQRLK